jgi:hypothetical protein
MSECKLQWELSRNFFRGGNRRNLGHAGRKHIGIHWTDINKRSVQPIHWRTRRNTAEHYPHTRYDLPELRPSPISEAKPFPWHVLSP